MKRVIATKKTSDDSRAFVSEHLKIADKSMEYAIRKILFDSYNTIDWDYAAEVFRQTMSELASSDFERIRIDQDKYASLVKNMFKGALNDEQKERAEEVSMHRYVRFQEIFSDHVDDVLYVQYGLKSLRDFEASHDEIIILDESNPIWTTVQDDIGE